MTGATRLTNENPRGLSGRRDAGPVGRLCACTTGAGSEQAVPEVVDAYRLPTGNALGGVSRSDSAPTQTL